PLRFCFWQRVGPFFASSFFSATTDFVHIANRMQRNLIPLLATRSQTHISPIPLPRPYHRPPAALPRDPRVPSTVSLPRSRRPALSHPIFPKSLSRLWSPDTATKGIPSGSAAGKPHPDNRNRLEPGTAPACQGIRSLNAQISSHPPLVAPQPPASWLQGAGRTPAPAHTPSACSRRAFLWTSRILPGTLS